MSNVPMNTFREAVRNVLIAFTQAIDVSNLLLLQLQLRDVITPEQRDQLWVRLFSSIFI